MATLGYGVILAYEDGASYRRVGYVKDVNGPGMKRDVVDVTNHDSPNGFKEFLAGLADPGEVTFTINFDPTNASHNQTTGLMALLSEVTTRNWQLIMPIDASSGKKWGYTFAALVTGFEPKGPVEEAITADVTLKVAGAVTLAEITPPA